MSETSIILRDPNNPDYHNTDLSTHNTAMQTPEQESQMSNSYQFSHLFPSHLYLNRNQQQQSQSDLQIRQSNRFDVPTVAHIGKDVESHSYDRVPIDQFGKNVLSKLGWQEGKAIGRNSKNGLVQPIDYLPRQHRLGLGAKPLTKEQIKKMGGDDNFRRLGVTEEYETGDLGKNYKSIHTQLKLKEKMKIGSSVQIIGGNHKGLSGKVIAISDPKASLKQQKQMMGEQVENDIDSDAYVSVELDMNSEIVIIKRKRLILSSEYQKLQNSDSENKKVKSRSRSKSKQSEKEKKKKKELKWILPGIVVRVISKKVENGKLYNKKLRIVDVLNKHKFSATPIDNQVHAIQYDKLREKELETVIPRDLNSQVMVLRGEYRGEVGKMLSRDKKKDEVIVQIGLTDIVKLSQDDICQRFE